MTRRLLPRRNPASTDVADAGRMQRLHRLLIIAAVAVALISWSPVHAATELRTPAGAITGVGERPGLSLTVSATTVPGRLGEATVVRDGRRVSVTFDCVRTYSVVGVMLGVPIVNEIGYASGMGTDGRRWYVYVNEGYSFEARPEAGRPVAHDTCGVGYQIGSGVPVIKVTGQATIAWTPAG